MNLKFKIPAHNIILIWAGILNLKLRTVFWNIFFWEAGRFEKRIALSEKKPPLEYFLNDITFQITTAFSFEPKCHRGWKWPQFSGSFGWTCLTFAPITFHPSKVCLKVYLSPIFEYFTQKEKSTPLTNIHSYSLINMRQLQSLFKQSKTWHQIVCWFSQIPLFLPVLALCDHENVLQIKTKQFYDHIIQELVKIR